MTRFVVRFRGSAPARACVARLRASPAVTVLEETPRMVLMEGAEGEIRKIVGDSPDVAIVPEQHYERPNPPLRIKKK
jgi:hypothetical protein